MTEDVRYIRARGAKPPGPVPRARAPCVALQEWLTGNKLTHREFAMKIGVTEGAVWKWIRRGVKPEADTLARVTAATDGAITAADWMG